MKNALIISGEYRTFDMTKESIQKFVLENDLDVYAHLWSTNPEESYDVIQSLKPKRILVEDPFFIYDVFKGNEILIKSKRLKVRNKDRLAGMSSMHYGRKKAYELIDRMYDNLVYTRYDLQFTNTFSIPNAENIITPIAESWGVISDIFAIIPLKYANEFFLYDKIVNLQSTPFEEKFINFLINDFKYPKKDIDIHNYDRYCPHMMLLRNFVINDIPFEIKNLPVLLQR